MSRDLTPKEIYMVDLYMMKENELSYLEFLQSSALIVNDEVKPLYTEEEISRRKPFPILCQLTNFDSLYLELSAISGGLEMLRRHEDNLQTYCMSGKGDITSPDIRWFEGMLDPPFYYREPNDAAFFQLIQEEAMTLKMRDVLLPGERVYTVTGLIDITPASSYLKPAFVFEEEDIDWSRFSKKLYEKELLNIAGPIIQDVLKNAPEELHCRFIPGTSRFIRDWGETELQFMMTAAGGLSNEAFLDRLEESLSSILQDEFGPDYKALEQLRYNYLPSAFYPEPKESEKPSLTERLDSAKQTTSEQRKKADVRSNPDFER